MATLATLLEVKVMADTAQAETGLARVNQRIGQAGHNALGQASHFTRLGFLMGGMGIQAGLAAKAMGGFIMSGLKGLMDYEQQARKTWTQVDDGVASLEQLKEVGIRIAKVIPVPLEQLQEGLYDIFSSMSVNLKEAETLLEAFAKGAVAGATDLGTAGKATIGIMNAFKRPISEVNKVMDEQFEIVRVSRVEYEDLAKTIGKATSSAATAGASFADLGGMMSFMTRRGMTAAQSATSAARAFDLMVNPKFAERMKEFGIEVADAEGNFRPMVDIAEDLRDKLSGLSEEARAHKLKELTAGAGGVIQAMRFFKFAINDADGELREFTEQIENSDGAMARAYEKMQSTATAIQLLKNMWEILKMELVMGLGPALHKIVELGQRILDWLLNLSDKTKENIGRAIAFTAALAGISSVLLGVASAIFMTTGGLVLMGVKTGLATKLTLGLYGTLGLLPGIMFLIIQNWDSIVSAFSNTGPLTDITDRFKQFGETVMKVWDDLTRVFREEGWVEGIKAIPGFLDDITDAFKDIDISAITESWAEGINNFLDKVDWGKLGAKLGYGIGVIIGELGSVAAEIADAFLTFIGKIDWFDVGFKAAKFMVAFFFGLVAGVIASGVLIDVGKMIASNLGPIMMLSLVSALVPKGLAVKVAQALGKIPIIGAFAKWGTSIMRGLGVILLAPFKKAFAPLGLALKGLWETAFLKGLMGLDKIKAMAWPIISRAIMGLVRLIVTRLPFLFGPIGIAIGAAILGIFLISKYWGPIKEFFTELGNTVKENAGIMAENVREDWEAIKTAFTEKFDEIKTAITEKFSEIKESVSTFFSELGTSISEWINNNPAVIALKNIWTSIQTAWDQGLAYFIGWLAGWGVRIVVFFFTLPSRILAILTEGLTIIFNKFLEWGGQVIEWVVQWGSDVITNVNEWFSKLPGRIEEWFNKTKENITKWFSERIADFKKWGSDVITSVNDWFSKLPGRIENFLNEAKIKLQQKFSEMKQSAIDKSTEIYNGVVDWFSKIPERTANWFQRTKDEMARKLSDALAEAKRVAGDILRGFIDGIAGLPDEASAIFSKMARAISNWAGDMWSRAKKIGSAIWEGFKDGVGISSPSYLERAMDHIASELLSKIHRLGPDASKIMARAAAMISEAFNAKLNTRFVSPKDVIQEDDPRWNPQTMGNKTGTKNGRYFLGGREVDEEEYQAWRSSGKPPPKASGVYIENMYISSPTPEQQFIDFERKIVALEMRVGSM